MKKLADELKISVNTVKYHIKNALAIHSITYGRLSETADIVYVLGKLKKNTFLDYPLSFLFCLTNKRTCNYAYRRKI